MTAPSSESAWMIYGANGYTGRLIAEQAKAAGLSPVLVDRVLSVLARLSEQGTAVLLVEQLVEKALAVANRVYALSQGKIVLEATAQSENLSERLERAYFGL